MQWSVVSAPEIFGHRLLASLAQLEAQVRSASVGDFLDDTRDPVHLPGRTGVRGQHTNSSNEALQPNSLAIWETLLRRQYIWVSGASEEVEAEIDEGPWFVHRTSGYIDVDQHFADARTNGLEISAPKDDTATDVLRLSIGEERANVEGILHRRFHAHDDIQGLVYETSESFR